MRFYIACLFTPLLAVNIDRFLEDLFNGDLPTKLVNLDLYTGAASGVLVYFILLIPLYLLHIYLFYAQVYKLSGRWYLYICYGAIPCIFIGVLELSIGLNLNYIGQLYFSFLISTSFWLLASAKWPIHVFKIDNILFINGFFMTFFALLCVYTHYNAT